MWANPEVFTKIFSDLFTIHQAFEKHWDTIYFQQGSFYLVGGLAHFLSFHVLGRIIPTDELIFFRGVAQPPTSYDCYGNLVPLCTTGLSTSSLRRRFLRQRLAVQISIDLELFLGWSRLIFFKHSWEMLGMWGKPKEMSAMLAPIVLFMFFSPSTAFENWSKVGLKLLSTKRIRSNLKGRCVADRKGPDDLGCLKYIEIYIYNYIYMII